ncbi:Rho guanine nucleotide exchange factor 7 [Trichoplax sp. H2]|nr:Rho guanine nucleotide exchange factor 7 [Trichoplax sp. H2]|eukprot:RDD46056.1 Rho guanine nucleotide exchange factor 7 [Trichoplax sp. H2]
MKSIEKEGKRRLVKAKHDYSADSNSDLSFKKGDYIEIIEQPDRDWWKGKLRDKDGYGWFPANHVTEVKVSNVRSSTLPRQNTSGQYYGIVVRDIVKQEEEFIEKLRDIYQYYFIPFKKEEVLPVGDSETVCGKFESLIKIHEGFLKRLKDETARSNNEQSIGSCFLNYLRQFEAFYRFYFINFAVASVLVRRNRIKLDAFIENKRLPTHQGITFATCIEMPLKHFEAYLKALGGLLENIRDGHPCKAALRDALVVFSELFNLCTKLRKAKETEIDIVTKKLIGFEGKYLAHTYGKAIYICTVWIKAAEAKERYLLIFDKVIVLVSAGSGFQGYCLEGTFSITPDLGITVVNDVIKLDENSDGYKCAIEIRDNKSYETYILDVKDFEQILRILQKKLNDKLNVYGQLSGKAKIKETMSHTITDESSKYRASNENLLRRKSASLNFIAKQQPEELGVSAVLGDKPVLPDHKEKRRTVGQYYKSLVMDLLSNEKVYVQELKNILSQCLLPLKSERSIFTGEFQPLYTSLDSIKILHEAFIVRLTKNIALHENDQSIGSFLLENRKELEENYKSYFSCHPVVASTIIQNKEALDALLEKMQLPKMETSSNVTSCISIPLRHLEAYPNKLRELLNSVEDHHPGRNKLLEAFELLSDINKSCAIVRKNKEIETDIITGKLEGFPDENLKGRYGLPMFMCKTQMNDPEASDRYVLVFDTAVALVGVVEKLSGYYCRGDIPISANFKVNTKLRNSGNKSYTSIEIEDKTVSYSFDLEINDAKNLLSLLNRLTYKFDGKGTDTTINEGQRSTKLDHEMEKLSIDDDIKGREEVIDQAIDSNGSAVKWNVKMLRPSRLAKTSVELLVKEENINDSRKFLPSSRKKQGKTKSVIGNNIANDESLNSRTDPRNAEDSEVLRLIEMYTTNNRSRHNVVRH